MKSRNKFRHHKHNIQRFEIVRSYIFRMLLVILLATSAVGCKKFIEVDPPVTNTNTSIVFNTDANAIAVLTDVYAQMSNNRSSQYGLTSVSLFAGLSADELTLFVLSNTNYLPYYRNSLTNQSGSGNFWSSIYPTVFIANSAIEGISQSSKLSLVVKQQLLGEAKFIRAMCYFYLVNLYGEVPLTLTTDPKINGLLSRTPYPLVMKQIITDLEDAQNLLSTNYLDGTLLKNTTEKVRPTKWAAAAMLARAYLYNGEWVKAEAQANTLINNSSFSLDTLNGVFLKNSKEAIWQLQPVRSGNEANTAEGILFVLPGGGPSSSNPVYISNNLLNGFESGDQRKAKWVNSVLVGTTTYFYPFKYKVGLVSSPVKEYSMVLRLAEQFLIRAEARAQQNNITGAQSDLNAIRARATLGSTMANDKASLLTAIMQERKVELFTEWGHRWLDLKRSGNINGVMNVVTPIKGGVWNTNWQWYPVPLSEIKLDPNLTQNAGY